MHTLTKGIYVDNCRDCGGARYWKRILGIRIPKWEHYCPITPASTS